MGSGCNPKKINTPVNPISSDEVIYQGPPNTELGICTGDTMTEVEQAIINRVMGITFDGKDITLESIVLELCDDIKNIVGNNPKTILNITEALIKYSCVLKSRIDTLQGSVIGSIGNTAVDFKCVTPPVSFSFTSGLQAIINDYCVTKAVVNQLATNSGSTTIVDEKIYTSLNSLISTPGGNGLKKTVDSNSQQVSYSITGVVPPETALPYFGSLSYFDSSGKGLSGTRMEGWYLCNGNNGTPDMRGFVPVGAIQGVPGGNVDPSVDPSSDPSLNYAVNQIGGRAKVTLVPNNLPPHTHPVIDPGHDHSFRGYDNENRPCGSSCTRETKANTSKKTATATTGISIGPNTTTSLPVDVRQPYRACNFIIRFD